MYSDAGFLQNTLKNLQFGEQRLLTLCKTFFLKNQPRSYKTRLADCTGYLVGILLLNLNVIIFIKGS